MIEIGSLPPLASLANVSTGGGGATGPTITLGQGATGLGTGFVAIGLNTVAGATGASGAIAIGAGTSSSASYAVGIGSGVGVSSAGDIAIGQAVSSSCGNGVTIGPNASSGGTSSVNLGLSVQGFSNLGVTIGGHANSSGGNSVCIGYNAVSGGANSVVLGYASSDSGNNSSVVLGYNISAPTSTPNYLNLAGCMIGTTAGASNLYVATQGGVARQGIFPNNSPSTGFTATIPASTSTYFLNPTGTLATGTVIMPAAPVNGQEIEIVSSKIVTSLTLSPNSGQTIVSAATTLAAGVMIKYTYFSATSAWYRNY